MSRSPRPALRWWLRPPFWLWLGAAALVVGAGFAFYTEFWMLLAAAPVFIALGVAAWIAIVARVHARARDGRGTAAEFDALLRDYLPFAAPLTLDALRERYLAAAAVAASPSLPGN